MSVWTALIMVGMVPPRAVGTYEPSAEVLATIRHLGLSRHRALRPYLVAIGQRLHGSRPSDKWQTRREAGTQSHGPHAGSRVAEQEVDRGGPEIPGGAARRTLGHHPRCGGRGAAQRSIQLPPLRIDGRRVTH